jgi:hypothetical protein
MAAGERCFTRGRGVYRSQLQAEGRGGLIRPDLRNDLGTVAVKTVCGNREFRSSGRPCQGGMRVREVEEGR